MELFVPQLQFCPSSESLEVTAGVESNQNIRMKVPVSQSFLQKDYEYYSISFSPRRGVIGPREQVVVQMQFLAKRMVGSPGWSY